MKAFIGDEKIVKSKNYFFEPKLDGYRALCFLRTENLDYTVGGD
jgi:ATP-dependent DNA ligase